MDASSCSSTRPRDAWIASTSIRPVEPSRAGVAAVEIAAGHGWPDGMTIDAEGFLWVGLWDGWAVERFAPDGTMDRRVELPAAQVTSCTFGGPDLDELYITTGQEGFPPGGLPDQPHAGGLFRYRAGVNGLPTRQFAG